PDVLRRACQLRGWTTQGLAQQAGIGWNTAQRALDGRPVTTRVLFAIAVAVSETKGQIHPEVQDLIDGRVA
ncbi:MAG: helix-turn-helix domain-containing protein, partial [Candidatus Dormibacteraceae bacterium]